MFWRVTHDNMLCCWVTTYNIFVNRVLYILPCHCRAAHNNMFICRAEYVIHFVLADHTQQHVVLLYYNIPDFCLTCRQFASHTVLMITTDWHLAWCPTPMKSKQATAWTLSSSIVGQSLRSTSATTSTFKTYCKLGVYCAVVCVRLTLNSTTMFV